MAIVSKVLSILGMGESASQSTPDETPAEGESSGSDSEVFGEKSMDDLVGDQEEESEEE